jgi:hypothetical protein
MDFYLCGEGDAKVHKGKVSLDAIMVAEFNKNGAPLNW